MAVRIISYQVSHRQAVLDLSMLAWTPVFPQMQAAVPNYVFSAFYPKGWKARQIAELGAFLDEEGERAVVAVDGDDVLGWVGIRLHPEDSMGEIYVIAVHPAVQRRGVAAALLDHGFAQIKAAGMTMVMVETGDDPGHAASRATYERAGFERWPVARYFKKL
jgi:ribosomal protein S18 acetylase RimI-like enzyme